MASFAILRKNPKFAKCNSHEFVSPFFLDNEKVIFAQIITGDEIWTVKESLLGKFNRIQKKFFSANCLKQDRQFLFKQSLVSMTQ